MCLAIPARVVSIDESADTATVAVGEVRKQVSLTLVEDVREGDFVLVHVGYAINTIQPDEARRTLELFAEAGLLGEATG